ncbi:thiol:disulfide interchange protein DsbA/DsbL [Ignatzschineria rhizosphaerae]|uniref:Thiol:disulfide interchange protein n=1 Tax=Ignatzschineria rhizosphaerae TaxID=2923279 RepID=A0ABY3X2B6_9GAMM|nr:thiol:disulfide interchange protein DsbA/DsbL [Ignatzschineria rhizosphaerae]UNM95152.1 thiol:disulfide interchange protein DsbA/DsbL [Ignatzschineria rhizosphaerae]
MLKKLITTTTLVLATMASTAMAQNFYQNLSPKVDPIYDPEKIEVVEIFSYACPACNTFEPFFANWKETQKDVSDVEVISLAAPGQGVWTLYAQVFYTLESMNELERGHQAFFDAVHKDRKRFINEKQIADFMATQGIDKDKFLKAWNGFSTKSSFNRGTDLIVNQYRVPYTPAVVIDGQYVLSASDAANRPGNGNAYEKFIITIDEVVNKVRADRQAQKPTSVEEEAQAQ